MARQFDMCEVCKLDKAQTCNYDCIKQRSDFAFRFFTCSNFIYDDGNPITNAEAISTLLKIDSDSAADEIWSKITLNNGCLDYHDFKRWLREEN